MKTMLNSSMVTSIEEACALLLYKNLHVPEVEEDESLEDKPAASSTKKEVSPEMQMLQQMKQMNMMLIQQQQKQFSPQPRSPRRPVVNAVTTKDASTLRVAVPVQPSGTLGRSGRTPNIRMGPDTRTQEGVKVCGRCE
ncbi:hypothetical protein PC116_g23863 [Phytophthora cactorum]|uniref:Uncharacterized protein n=2 Tax=Phytophthora cactorum TaxID=29920 RepID=A0A8T1BEX8_9STRA|nr:hypothetical protein Pcac1_g8454 [Phytophthora cactorum]KAG2798527.1 hypothetical protein PC111_g20816 [Phytophthora cactorum]KAG2877396.1 hypothetical protein PC114_g23655 [Phytophthora cactorum]KAG2902284.1 hypothetical protein PC117_g21512 [Phytophthora cactorum]KAG2980237.1 hypothetical protein PC119_g21316 [Phytophthora cactorum]